MNAKIRVNKKIDASDFMMELALFLLALNFLLYQCFDMDDVKDMVRFIAIGMMAVGVLLNLRSFRVDWSILLYTLFCLLTVALGKSVSINWPVLLVTVIALRQMDTDKVTNMLVRVTTVVVIAYFALRVGGMIEDRVYGGASGRVRNTLGFSNVNAAALFFFSWTVLLFTQKKANRFLRVVSLVLFLWVVQQTDTRSVAVAFVLYVLVRLGLGVLAKHTKKRGWKRLCVAVILLEICVVVISVCYPLLLRLFPALDEFLSYRLTLGTRAIQALNFRNWLFGGRAATTDNFFLTMLFQHGVIVVLVGLFFVTAATWHTMRQRDVRGVSYIFSLWVMSMMETFLLRPELTLSILFWHFVFNGKKQIVVGQKRQSLSLG